ncbi:hypothetical protein NE865_14879 [Phthorimaea operculella]|nr:hypothetical protein NE865_14879 [Phthorimaea operculella]
MASDESDDEPLALLAAAKQADPEKYLKKLSADIDVDYDPKPKKKKAKKTKNKVIKNEALTIQFERTLKQAARTLIQRPDDVWLYLKDFNPSGPYSCLLCSEWFISKSKVVIHYVLNHKKDYCGICRYFVLDREAWVAHVQFHSPWPCSQCDETFPLELELRQHLSAAHKLVHCRLCHFRLPDNDQYNFHLLQKHNVTNVSCRNDPNVWELEFEGGQNFSCLLCSKANNPPTAFFSHFLGYHHFTIKCIANMIGGQDTPFLLFGADLSQPFIECLKDQGKCGYVDLDRNISVVPEFSIKREDYVGAVTVKEEVYSDDNEETKEEIKPEETVREDFELIKSYKGDQDFDVTQMELIVLNKKYFDYLQNVLTDINSKTIPINSQIEYEKENQNTILNVDCTLCPATHPTMEASINHMSKMHSVKTVPIFCCRLCVTTFETLNELDHHAKEELQEFDDLWLCQFCDKEFDNRHATRGHLAEHQDILQSDNCFSPHIGFKCRYCPTLFWNEPDREQHQIEMHFQNNKDNYYKCECEEVFSDKIWFTYHYFEKHLKDESAATNTRLYKCCLCSLVLSSVHQMRDHFEKEHPKARKVFCSLEGCQYRPLCHKKSFQLHLRRMHSSQPGARDKDAACTCTVCGREFATWRACCAHTAAAHGPGKFKCTICKAMLTSVDERKLHYLLMHPGKHPFSCNVCGKSFLYKSSLYMHKKEHSAVKEDYTCEICHKVFAKKDSFREHQQIHEGPRHACSYCPMRFVQRSNMLRHERRHTGERPYSCPHCERTFSDKGACSSHVKTHTRETTYDCLYCGASFAQKSKLTYHIRRHTGENLETCAVCAKLFTSACSLREHMKTHAAKSKGESAKCPLCDRAFNDERYMMRHLRTVHTNSRHPCPLCRKQLSSIPALRSHVLTHSDSNMFWVSGVPTLYNIVLYTIILAVRVMYDVMKHDMVDGIKTMSPSITPYRKCTLMDCTT